jgi:tol-pal system protein YbgF
MEVGRIARWAALALPMLALATGCVTVAEFRKLDRDVQDMKRGGVGGGSGERLAELAAQVDSLEREVAGLEGRLEVAEHDVETALREARSARAEAASSEARAAAERTATPATPETDANAAPAPAAPEKPSGAVGLEDASGSAEVEAYRSAYAAWRSGDPQACIDRFRNFLQTYADSAYADDAAYWMADCYFKYGDYKTAVLRFDDVVARYPTGNKAADALYRQGEALLRLGPGYGKAAGKAFERVLREYPDSARAPEAKRQLDLLGSG